MRAGFTFTLQGAECSKADLRKRLCSEWNYDNGRDNLKLREALWCRRPVPIKIRKMELRAGPDRLLLAAR